jgi:hypothetical protein
MSAAVISASYSSVIASDDFLSALLIVLESKLIHKHDQVVNRHVTLQYGQCFDELSPTRLPALCTPSAHREELCRVPRNCNAAPSTHQTNALNAAFPPAFNIGHLNKPSCQMKPRESTNSTIHTDQLASPSTTEPLVRSTPISTFSILQNLSR